jgi:outer membrane protein
VAKGLLYPELTFGGTFFTNYSSVATNNTYINTTDFVSKDYVVVNGSQSPVIYKQDNFSTNKIGYKDQLNNNISNSFGFSLTVPIFNALSQRNRVKQARLTYQNTVLAESTTKIQLNQDIERAYINMNTAADRYKTILTQVDAFGESFRAAGVRFQQGVGTSIDYLITKNSLDRSNINLIIAKYDYVLRTKILDYYQGRPLF